MASLNLSFDDIRLIICVQGYSLDSGFILREIGFWSHGFSGSIPFNCRVNKDQIDPKNQRTIYACEEEINGIKLKNNFEFGLSISETKAVLRSLYHICDNSNGKYIGICRDGHINGLLFKAGLGNYVYDLDNLNQFKNSTDKCPSNKDLQYILKSNPKQFSICKLHDRLRTDDVPICAKVKSEFLAEYCITYVNPNVNPEIIHIIETSIE